MIGYVYNIFNSFVGYVKDAPNTTSCVNCDECIAQGELAVIAPKFRDQVSLKRITQNELQIYRILVFAF